LPRGKRYAIPFAESSKSKVQRMPPLCDCDYTKIFSSLDDAYKNDGRPSKQNGIVAAPIQKIIWTRLSPPIVSRARRGVFLHQDKFLICHAQSRIANFQFALRVISYGKLETCPARNCVSQISNLPHA